MGYALGAWLCSSLAYVFVEYFYPHKRLQAVVVLMVIVLIFYWRLYIVCRKMLL